MGNDCSGGGGACKGSYYAWDPQTLGAQWCADEGQTCKAEGGKATVFYGGALSWHKITLQKGQSIKCNAAGWKRNSGQECGCDPAPALKKWCFKIQEYDPNQSFCCGGEWQIPPTGFSLYRNSVSAFQAGSEKAAKDEIRPPVEEHATPWLDVLPSDYNSVDEITDAIYDQICKPCSLSSAHSQPLGLDMDLNEWADLNQPADTAVGTAPTIDMQLLLPLVVALLTVVNLVVLLFVCVRRCFGKKKGYDVVGYDVESAAECEMALK